MAFRLTSLDLGPHAFLGPQRLPYLHIHAVHPSPLVSMGSLRREYFGVTLGTPTLSMECRSWMQQGLHL